MARQPFFNTNYQVASTAPAANLIAQSGAAQGQMFENLGKTIGSSIEKFRKNREEKEKEKNAEEQFLRIYDEDPTNPIFQTFGVSNREEAAVAAKDISKDPALVNQAMSFYKGQIAMEDRERADAERKAGQRFAQRVLGQIPDPRGAEISQEIQGLRTKLEETGGQPPVSASGIPGPKKEFRQQPFINKIEALEREREGLGEIPMFALEGKSFLDAYGKPGSPEEAGFVANELLRRQAREDANLGKGLDMFTKGLGIQSQVETKAGNTFASKYKPPKGTYVFDPSEAANLVTEAAQAKNITLTPEQTKSAASKIRVLDPIKINESKRKFMSDKRLGQASEILESADYLSKFLEPNAEGKYNALTDTIAIEKLARMVQPTGILTDTDIARVSGSQDLHGRFERALSKLTEGTLSPKDRDDLQKAAQAFAKKASQVLRDGVERGSKSIGKQFNIPTDVVKDRFFAEELTGVPSDPKATPPSNDPGATRQFMLPDGTEAEGQVIKQLPDGNVLIQHKGQLFKIPSL